MPTAEETAQGHGKRRGSAKRNGRTENGNGVLGKAFGGDTPSERGWDETDPRFLQWVLVAMGHLGGAVTFGRSRDRQALSVTLLLEGERTSVWIAPSQEVEAELQKIAERLEAIR